MDPFTGLILGGLISGGVSGGFNLAASNNADTGAAGPEMWETIRDFVAAVYNAAATARSQEEYEERIDRLVDEQVRVARENMQQNLSMYDAGTQEVETQLRNIERQVRDFGNQVTRSAQGMPKELIAERARLLQDIGRRAEITGGEFDRRTAAAMRDFGAGSQGFISRLAGEGNDLDAEYMDYENRAFEQLDKLGEQSRADVNRAFDESTGRITQDLISRGLISSSEAGKELTGDTERRSAELRRLDESLAQGRLGVLEAFGMPRLAAQERGTAQRAGYEYGTLGELFGAGQTAAGRRLAFDEATNTSKAAYDAALTGDIQRARELALAYKVDMEDRALKATQAIPEWNVNDTLNRVNLWSQGGRDLLSVLSGIDYMPPQPSNLNFQLGYNTASYPRSASPYASMIAGAAPGIGNALGAAALQRLSQPSSVFDDPRLYEVNHSSWYQPYLWPTTNYSQSNPYSWGLNTWGGGNAY